MRPGRHTWAVVLAAGDGTRLAALTTDAAGNAVPKQFCSLEGRRSLLQDAVLRARRIVPAQRVCAMVSEQHRRYWPQVRSLVSETNIIVQPANRGTAHGILLAVLSLLARDPFARIVFLPADHHVHDENALADAVRAAAARVDGEARGMALIGIEPDEPDPELGYIVPGHLLAHGAYSVLRFVEKPHAQLAGELCAAGALWNSFIFAADARSLLGLFRERMPRSLEAMTAALAREDSAPALEELYRTLSSVDFSQAIAQGSEGSLSVSAAPPCGWSDLGTPKRVAETLRRLGTPGVGSNTRPSPISADASMSVHVNLALQHARLGLANWGSTP